MCRRKAFRCRGKDSTVRRPYLNTLRQLMQPEACGARVEPVEIICEIGQPLAERLSCSFLLCREGDLLA